MNLHLVGCSHHNSSVEVRQRLAFSPDQVRQALVQLRQRFPKSEAVLLSTCNRTELYTAATEHHNCPSHHDLVAFLAAFHGLEAAEIYDDLFERTGEDTVRHLFTVTAGLDSMVVGEAQILSQVKRAYELATDGKCAGPLTHGAFQAAIRVAKRVATETAINQKRLSIASVAVADFARGIFERFDDKHVLVIGAGEMAEETLRYLLDEGATDVTVVNRSFDRAQELAEKFHGRAEPWESLDDLLTKTDLVVSTTGARESVITLDRYKKIENRRYQKPLFILDLAVPQDVEPAVGERLGVYLYSIDDLQFACDANRRAREKEWPKAERIIEQETGRFMTELHHRITGPTIRRLTQRAAEVKDEELLRLFNKLEKLDSRDRKEIQQAFDRLVSKLLHPPLESLRDDAQSGAPHGLLDALKKLFQLQD